MSAAGKKPGAGLLSIVATPIGNLQDITLRALSTLRDAELVLAEDTRRTRLLLSQHAISARTQSLHAHSPDSTLQRLLRALQGGARYALVTDAGMPLVSDPGGELVRLCAEHGVRVEVVPGPSAVITALAASGVPFASFRFAGFAPRTGGARAVFFQRIGADAEACVLFESPRRLQATLEDLEPVLAPERRLAVCRELTKLHEEVARGTVAELRAHFAGEVLGEITIVVGAGPARARTAGTPTAASIATRVRQLLSEGLSTKDAARTLAQELHCSRREAYAKVQAITDEL